MTRYVELDAVLEALCGLCRCKYCEDTGDRCREWSSIDLLPDADVVSGEAYRQTAHERDAAVGQLAKIYKQLSSASDDIAKVIVEVMRNG